ncbi:MAG: hypothetical protein ABFC77_15835 [Thermoguttaceae bacterium]
MVNLSIFISAVIVLASADHAKNPIFDELTQRGLAMSDGSTVKLPPPIAAEGLDAAGQRAALEKASGPSATFDELIQKSYYTPTIVKIRTVRPFVDEKSAVRSVDLWFVARGDWKTLTSKEFLESVFKSKSEGRSGVVSKLGELTEPEMAARKLLSPDDEGCRSRFIYTTFSLFERVELSTTRHATVTRGKDFVLAAARVDPRFDGDRDFPNQWRPLVRDAEANIKPGPAKPYAHAGGYAKITRLKEPSDTVLVECHLVYEEPYGWFDGVNLVKQKVPAMVKEKARTFRRKLALAKED